MNLNISTNNEQSSQSTFVKGDIVRHKAFDAYKIPPGIAAIPILCVICTDCDFMTCFDTHTNKEIVVPINQFRKISHISL